MGSVTIAGRDVTGRAFDAGVNDIDDVVITMTDRPAGVVGSVHGVFGRAASPVSVVLFPVDRSLWGDVWFTSLRFRQARNVPGAYAFGGVPAGDYFLAAVDDAALTEWPSVPLLDRLARNATTLAVRPGRTHFASLARR